MTVVDPAPLPVRVYYEDTDAGGVVYHAAYLRFAERGRTETLRRHGDHKAGAGSNSGLRAAFGVTIAVHRCDARFLQPARLDDLLHVHTMVDQVRGARFSVDQAVMRDDTVLVRLAVQLACIGRHGRAVRLPPPLRQALENQISAQSAPKM